MLALLQQIMTLSAVGAALSWLVYFQSTAPVLAWTGFMALVFGYSLIFIVEFVIARRINKFDPVPQATWQHLFAAWWGETVVAAQVFCWRQPFRANAIADRLGPEAKVLGRRGVVFVHGFFCNRGVWTPWLERLQSQDNAFIAVDLEPLFGSIDDYAPQIDDAVRRVRLATGLAPLLVCHSMGGLAVRAWIKLMNGQAQVDHVVTIGTPHRGTWLARFGHGKNSHQMRLGSCWLAKLNHDLPTDSHVQFTCWYSNCDNIVFPASNATLPGALHRLFLGAGHVQLAFMPEVMQATLALLNDESVENTKCRRL